MNETTRKTLEQVVEECGLYPVEAFEFVRQGLNYAVERTHGPVEKSEKKEDADRHVSGQDLSLALRDFAILKYGCMAGAVLQHWQVRKTLDFGKIVFAMVDNRLMQKTAEDDVADFENVFDFAEAFEPPVRPKTGASTPVFRL